LAQLPVPPARNGRARRKDWTTRMIAAGTYAAFAIDARMTRGGALRRGGLLLLICP